MNIDMLFTATIDEKTMCQLLKEGVERETGRKVSKVEIKVGTRLEGYGPGEYQTTYVDGAKITFAKTDKQVE